MNAWIISDIHSVPMEAYWNQPLLVPEADICICAGDISGLIDRSIDFLNSVIAPRMPVVATLGNHDYYGRSIEWALDFARKHTSGTNIHILENDTFEINGLRVIGATLWTDYEIPFGVPEPDEELPLGARRDLAFHVCTLQLTDYTEIYRSDARRDNEIGFVTIGELISRHIRSRAYIKRQLAKPFDGKTMVLSHHAPSPHSIHPNFLGSPSNAAFASDLTAIIKRWKPDYWVHGHVHHFLDYLEDETRIICNARGYFHERGVNGFRPGFVIEI